MKKHITIIFILYVIIHLSSCEDSISKNKYPQKIKQIEEIKKTFEDQKRVESEEMELNDPYKLSKKDLSLVLLLEEEGLIKAGFKTIDKATFDKRIFDIFGIRVDSNNCSKIKISDSLIRYYRNDLDGKAETLADNEFELQSISNNLFLSRSSNFFTQMYLLRDLIELNNDDYKLKLPQNIIARNKYLLNDDKSLFPWLVNNDSIFMKDLLVDYGYTNDKELLKWIIRTTSFKEKGIGVNNGIEFGHIIYNRTCNNTFKINTAIFEAMLSDMSLEQPKYLDNLLEYITYLSDLNNDPELTFSERSSIIAHVLYFCQDLAINKGYDSYKYQTMGFFEEHLDQNGKFYAAFKKNKYYNLSNFDVMWNDAILEGDGISIPGEE
jgi:hypothetical protein